jgi:hypothetical protein
MDLGSVLSRAGKTPGAKGKCGIDHSGDRSLGNAHPPAASTAIYRGQSHFLRGLLGELRKFMLRKMFRTISGA